MKKTMIINAIEEMKKEGKKRGASIYKAIKELRGKRLERFFFIILSTRTRDEATLRAVKRLFEDIESLEELCSMNVEEIEEKIRGVGFYKTKARRVKEICKALLEKYNGQIPRSRKELMSLPGVGRKVANVILSDIFKEKVIGVDVHVHRIANRIGWVNTRTPEETEKELKKIVPKDYWKDINVAMVGYGQTVCLPKNPKCEVCRLKEICNYYNNKFSKQ